MMTKEEKTNNELYINFDEYVRHGVTKKTKKAIKEQADSVFLR